MTMTADTAAVLTAVLPLVLLAFMAERRNLTMKARRSTLFLRVASYSASASVLGLIVSVVGVQNSGLVTGWEGLLPGRCSVSRSLDFSAGRASTWLPLRSRRN